MARIKHRYVRDMEDDMGAKTHIVLHRTADDNLRLMKVEGVDNEAALAHFQRQYTPSQRMVPIGIATIKEGSQAMDLEEVLPAAGWRATGSKLRGTT